MNPTNATIAQLSKQYGVDPGELEGILIKGGWTTATGLVNYDLEPLARIMLANPTPLRQVIPRVPGKNGDTAHRWKAILSLPSDVQSSPYVSEGQRSIANAPTVQNFLAPYAVIQKETFLTFEAEEASTNFDDAKAKSRLVLMQDVFRQEEKQWLCGNYNYALGTAVAPTLVPSTVTGNSLSGTMSVIVVPLTADGVNNAAVSAAGVLQQYTRVNLDQTSDTINGGVGIKSSNTTQAMSANNTLTCTTTPIAGACGYAWYLGTAGSERIAAITTLASVTLGATPSGSNQLASALLSTDFSFNDGGTSGSGTTITAMNGILTFAAGGLSLGSYLNGLTGGATLTSDGEGGIAEITTMFQSMYLNYKMGPTDLWMGADTARKVRNLVIANGSSAGNPPLARYMIEAGKPIEVIAGGTLPPFHNFYTGETVMTHVHPYLPAGMILATASRLPFTIDEEPNPLQCRVTRDYWQIEWPLRTTRWETAIRVRETLENRFPPSLGLIYNIS